VSTVEGWVHRQSLVLGLRVYGEHRSVSLWWSGVEPPVESRGRAPGQGVKHPEAEKLLAFWPQSRTKICSLSGISFILFKVIQCSGRSRNRQKGHQRGSGGLPPDTGAWSRWGAFTPRS